MIVFGGLSLGLVAYVARAAYPFYTKPVFVYDASEPGHVNRVVEEWLASTDEVEPLGFDWNIFRINLMNPWDEVGFHIGFSSGYASPYYSDPTSMYAKECLLVWWLDRRWKFIRRKDSESWKLYEVTDR